MISPNPVGVAPQRRYGGTSPKVNVDKEKGARTHPSCRPVCTGPDDSERMKQQSEQEIAE